MLLMKKQSDTRVLDRNAKVRMHHWHVNHPVCCVVVLIFQIYFGVVPAGTLGMISKTKKDIRQQSLESAQKTPKKHDVRRCITVRATLRDDICTMKLHVYMLHNNEWYLHSQSCLNHCNHPPLPPKAKAKSSVDMSPSSKTLVSTTNWKVSILIYSIRLTFFRVIMSL